MDSNEDVPKKKQKIDSKNYENTFQINLSHRPAQICDILTNLGDPNSSDLDFITDEDDDSEEEERTYEEPEQSLVGVGASFESNECVQINESNLQDFDVYIDGCIEDFDEQNVLVTSELISDTEMTNVVTVSNTNEHGYAKETQFLDLVQPGPSGLSGKTFSLKMSLEGSDSFSNRKFVAPLLPLIPDETVENTLYLPYDTSNADITFSEDLSAISNNHPVIVIPSNLSVQPTSDLDQTTQNNLLLPTQPCKSKKKASKPKVVRKEIKQKSSLCQIQTKMINKDGKNTKKTPPQTKWFAKDNKFAGKEPPFLGNVTYSLSNDNKGKTPLYFFSNLFPEEIYNIIAQESNLYAVQKGYTLGANPQDIKVFLAINIIMTYIKYPAYRMYWSAITSIRMDLIANAMSMKKFEKIKRFLHFTDNEKIPRDNKDIFIKIRPIVEKLNQSFKTCLTPVEFLAVDEMIIPFKGRNRAKQYIKSKPKKWGFKAWVLAGSNGYVYKFELYQGKLSTPPSKLGVIADTVLRLTDDLHGKNHKLFIDNLFVSIPLVRALQQQEIHVVGTLRSNRLPQQAEEILGSSKELLNKGRGAMAVATSEHNISTVRWVDSGVVSLVSTYAGVDPIDTVERWDGREKMFVKVVRPFCVAVYNKFMGGVDLADRMVAHYPHTLKNKKFYLRIFFHFVNVALSNAWIMFKDYTKTKLTFLEFKAAVAESLIAEGSKRKKVGRPSSSPKLPLKQRARPKVLEDIRFDNEGHYPEKVDTPNRCREANCRRRSRYRCKKCSIHLCPECMEAFHTKQI